jgi:hypothetical protein
MLFVHKKDKASHATRRKPYGKFLKTNTEFYNQPNICTKKVQKNGSATQKNWGITTKRAIITTAEIAK